MDGAQLQYPLFKPLARLRDLLGLYCVQRKSRFSCDVVYVILNDTQTICVYVFTYLIRVQSHKRLIDFSKRSVSSFLGVFKVGKGDA